MTLPSLRPQCRADYELVQKFYSDITQECDHKTVEECKEYTLSLTRTLALTVWNAALDAALEVLPKNYLEAAFNPHSLHMKQIRNKILDEARTAITSLKKNV